MAEAPTDFGQIDKILHPHPYDGVMALIEFPNGYRASIIKTSFSYGGQSGRWEVAVKHGDELVYDTPITNDVLGHLDEHDVLFACHNISKLPARK
jgi:hypothetical protein